MHRFIPRVVLLGGAAAIALGCGSGNAPCAGAACSAAGDATAPEAAVPVDGGPGAEACADVSSVTDGGDASSATWCNTQSPAHALCADFDEAALDFGWTNVATSPGASQTQDGQSATSLPFALLGTTSAAGQDARLYKAFTATANAIHLAFDLRIEASAAGCHGFKIVTTGDYNFTLNFTGPASILEEGPGSDAGFYARSYPLSTQLPLAQWTRVRIDLVLTGTRTISVSLDGVSALTQAIAPFFQNGAPTIAVGVHSLGAAACAVRYDDVTVDFE